MADSTHELVLHDLLHFGEDKKKAPVEGKPTKEAAGQPSTPTTPTSPAAKGPFQELEESLRQRDKRMQERRDKVKEALKLSAGWFGHS